MTGIQANEQVQTLWQKCRELIRARIGNARFETWFAKTRLLSFENDKATLWIPSYLFYEKYEDEFYEVLSNAIRQTFGENIKLKYQVQMLTEGKGGTMTVEQSGESKPKPEVKTKPAGKRTAHSAVDAEFNSQLIASHTFENYCVADSNLLVVTIAQSIAAKPRNNDFNPFFLYGDVGVGKTHLVQAVGLKVKENNPNAKVLFTQLRQFQNLYANAVIRKEVPQFINWFMEMDVLIFDDLQELAGKVKTASDALFPIFNHLHQNGKQLIFTCDRPPMELEGITDRLIDRFKWGLTEKLNRPDATLRRKILKFKAEKNGLVLPEEIIDFVSAHAINSVRELEGIVMGILTRSIALNKPITLQLAKDVLQNTVKIAKKKPVNFDMIVEATAEYFNLQADAIFTKSRIRDISDARQVIMYLAHKMTDLSHCAIGRKLNRGHGTVLHGIRNIEERMGVQPELAQLVGDIHTDLLNNA